MCDDIRLAKITTKPRFDNATCKLYHEPKSKALKMKRKPARQKQREANESLRKFRTDEAWWRIYFKHVT